jgi:hypothetical protein
LEVYGAIDFTPPEPANPNDNERGYDHKNDAASFQAFDYRIFKPTPACAAGLI